MNMLSSYMWSITISFLIHSKDLKCKCERGNAEPSIQIDKETGKQITSKKRGMGSFYWNFEIINLTVILMKHYWPDKGHSDFDFSYK